MRLPPSFGCVYKVEALGWERPYQDQDDSRETASIRGVMQGQGGLAGLVFVPGDIDVLF